MSTDHPATDPAAADAADPARTGRRRAILGLAGLAATGAAVVVAGAEPAGANGHGQSLTLGDPSNTAGATTGIVAQLGRTPALSVHNTNGRPSILAVAGNRSGILTNDGAITADSDNADGIVGLSSWADGVRGLSTTHSGVNGKSTQGIGVHGESAGAAGVWGETTSDLGIGVFGRGKGD
ncbi:MAG TPA: hypothetical protein VF228_13965, partial [Iamia sp.]